jgi:hypothetical protein
VPYALWPTADGGNTYSLTPNDAKLFPEFLQRERKDFSLDLRLVPIAGREVMVAVEPNKTFRLMRVGVRRSATLTTGCSPTTGAPNMKS